MCIFHNWHYHDCLQVNKWVGGVIDGVPYQTTIRAKVCSKCRKIKEIKGITTTVYICDFCTAATHTVEAEPLPQTIPCVSENCNGKMRKEIEND